MAAEKRRVRVAPEAQAIFCRVATSREGHRSPKSGQEGQWPAHGSEDTELGVLMEPEVGHGETEVYPRVQA
jgi:hypothetical protein